MPGRSRSFAQDREALIRHELDRIVCLASEEEVSIDSPDYSTALQGDGLPWRQQSFPLPERAIPPDRHALVNLVEELSTALEKGERILIHCGSGIGRTGSVATCILLRFKFSILEASIRIADAGSGLETPEQELLIDTLAKYWKTGQDTRSRS